ncbi:MAG: hypothetical protein VR67_18520 [Peptococcaceae bacterium BRH_c8a]|nr:MAG: hypothetical protein VR67_18520 [Peptococcaceae bacterium BRH_c8a]
MQLSEAFIKEFMAVFQAPGFVKPHLHHFVTEQEMKLAIGLKDQSLTGLEIAALLQEPLENVNVWLEQSYQRHVINKTVEHGTTLYTSGEFYRRLDNFCLFGNYHVLPKEVRRRLDQWCYEEYMQRHNYFKQVLDTEPDYDNCHNDWVLLLPEVEEMIDAAGQIRVLPCNCKIMADNCGHSREICIFFEQTITDRTGGRELSRAEAKALVRRLDKEGLMHTGGPYDWREKGPAVVCNCCTCCCYPFRAAQQLSTKGKWPRSRYVAGYDRDKCRMCGLCAKRCPFGAFKLSPTEVEKEGKKVWDVVFDSALCWGCGLCANTCPTEAITMRSI